MEIPEDVSAGAKLMRQWYLAYIEAGFSEEEAIAFLCRPSVSVQSQWPPEMMEALERQSALASKMLAEMDE
jgi:uncharacterized protein (DUF2384 family)